MNTLTLDESPRMQVVEPWKDYPFYADKAKYLKEKYLDKYKENQQK